MHNVMLKCIVAEPPPATLRYVIITLFLKVMRSMYLLGMESRITLILLTIDLRGVRRLHSDRATPTYRTGERASNMAERLWLAGIHSAHTISLTSSPGGALCVRGKN